MARLFTRASSEYLSVGSVAVSDYPFTLACWFNTDSTNEQHFISLGGSSGYYHTLQMFSTTVRCRSQAGLDYAFASRVGLTANTWQHACGVFVAADSRTVYLNGGNPYTNNTDSVPFNTMTGMSIGCRLATPNFYMSGGIAEAAIWNAALTAAEVASLGAGISPPQVRPDALAAYWPLVNTDQDWVGGHNMTAYNTPSWTDHPPKAIPPWYRRRGWAIAVTAGGVVVPVMYYHYAHH